MILGTPIVLGGEFINFEVSNNKKSTDDIFLFIILKTSNSANKINLIFLKKINENPIH